jgi:hypothetical protein
MHTYRIFLFGGTEVERDCCSASVSEWSKYDEG